MFSDGYMYYDELEDPPPCDCKYEVVQDPYMRTKKRVYVECFRCTVKRVTRERQAKRKGRLFVACLVADFIFVLHAVGELFRWWG